MDLATKGAVYGGLLMESGLGALRETTARPSLKSLGRCGPSPGVVP
ncbi:MAG: hypothetical protein Q8R72_15820 [Hylemonella sp.]|nr:hypothetical protein [Hylemonella sp.]